MTTKTCTKCGDDKDSETDFYHNKKTGSIMAQCKDCWKAFRKNSWHNNPQTKKTYKEYYGRNKDTINARARELRAQKRTGDE